MGRKYKHTLATRKLVLITDEGEHEITGVIPYQPKIGTKTLGTIEEEVVPVEHYNEAIERIDRLEQEYNTLVDGLRKSGLMGEKTE